MHREMTAPDHAELLAVLRACKGKVMLSGGSSHPAELKSRP
jgi:hypothetical protein